MVLYATNKFEIQINRNLIKNEKQKRKKRMKVKLRTPQNLLYKVQQNNFYPLKFKISLDLKLADIVETTYLGPCQTSMINFFCEHC